MDICPEVMLSFWRGIQNKHEGWKQIAVYHWVPKAGDGLSTFSGGKAGRQPFDAVRSGSRALFSVQSGVKGYFGHAQRADRLCPSTCIAQTARDVHCHRAYDLFGPGPLLRETRQNRDTRTGVVPVGGCNEVVSFGTNGFNCEPHLDRCVPQFQNSANADRVYARGRD